jgi:hypothetical protein
MTLEKNVVLLSEARLTNSIFAVPKLFINKFEQCSVTEMMNCRQWGF